jgi:uncharacterized protein (DUF1684 family)
MLNLLRNGDDNVDPTWKQDFVVKNFRSNYNPPRVFVDFGCTDPSPTNVMIITVSSSPYNQAHCTGSTMSTSE